MTSARSRGLEPKSFCAPTGHAPRERSDARPTRRGAREGRPCHARVSEHIASEHPTASHDGRRAQASRGRGDAEEGCGDREADVSRETSGGGSVHRRKRTPRRVHGIARMRPPDGPVSSGVDFAAAAGGRDEPRRVSGEECPRRRRRHLPTDAAGTRRSCTRPCTRVSAVQGVDPGITTGARAQWCGYPSGMTSS